MQEPQPQYKERKHIDWLELLVRCLLSSMPTFLSFMTIFACVRIEGLTIGMSTFGIYFFLWVVPSIVGIVVFGLIFWSLKSSKVSKRK